MLLGEAFLHGLERDLDCEGKAIGSLESVEQPDACDRHLVGAADRAEQIFRWQISWDNEGEVTSNRLQRWRGIGHSGMATRSRSRDRVEVDLRGYRARRRVEAPGEARVKLSKCCDDRLGAQAELGGTAGVPGRACIRIDLEIGDGGAGRFEQGENLRLGIKSVEALRLAALPAPVPAFARKQQAERSRVQPSRRRPAPKTRRDRDCDGPRQ